MVRSSARPTSQATQTKYARLRGLVKRKCAVFSVNSWIAPMAPNPRAKAMRIKAKVAEKAEVPKSSNKWVPTHTTPHEKHKQKEEKKKKEKKEKEYIPTI